MPEGKASEFSRAARALGFIAVRQKGSHQRWQHPDGRATTLPIHSATISGPLFYMILKQLGISANEFNELK